MPNLSIPCYPRVILAHVVWLVVISRLAPSHYSTWAPIGPQRRRAIGWCPPGSSWRYGPRWSPSRRPTPTPTLRKRWAAISRGGGGEGASRSQRGSARWPSARTPTCFSHVGPLPYPTGVGFERWALGVAIPTPNPVGGDIPLGRRRITPGLDIRTCTPSPRRQHPTLGSPPYLAAGVLIFGGSFSGGEPAVRHRRR